MQEKEAKSTDDAISEILGTTEYIAPDMLVEMFDKQEELQIVLGYNFSRMTDEEKAAYIKEYSQHLDHEMHEMLAEIPYFKKWKRYNQDPAETEYMWKSARKEFADALHFFLNVALCLGFTPSSLSNHFLFKNGVNLARQEDTAEYKKCIEE